MSHISDKISRNDLSNKQVLEQVVYQDILCQLIEITSAISLYRNIKSRRSLLCSVFYLSSCLSVCLSVPLPLCLFVSFSFSLSLYFSISRSFCLPVSAFLPFSISVFKCLFISQFLCFSMLRACLYVSCYLSLYLSLSFSAPLFSLVVKRLKCSITNLHSKLAKPVGNFHQLLCKYNNHLKLLSLNEVSFVESCDKLGQ